MGGGSSVTNEATGATRLILVRHGESEGNRDRTFTQNADVPITDVGSEQARAAAARIAACFRPVRIVSSPYRRARQTAEIIAAAFELPVDAEEALREQSFGILAGQPYDALLSDASYHDGPRWQWRPQGGESLVDVYARAVPALERIAGESVGQDVVVVSHGGVMLALCAFATGGWDDLSVTSNAGVVLVEYCQGRYRPPVKVD